MKIHRFIVKNPLTIGRFTITDADLCNQIKNVLRLGLGESIILSDGALNEAEAMIIDFPKDAIVMDIAQVTQNKNEPSVRVVLYAAVLRRENFEFVVQKATEVGASEIVPVVSERTVKFGLKKERLEKIIREAAEQSGRGIVPVLREATDFPEALQMAKSNEANILFDKTGVPFLKKFFASTPPQKVGIFIGPEGGFTEREIGAAKEAGFIVASLGNLTLRAETAAAIATYLAASPFSEK